MLIVCKARNYDFAVQRISTIDGLPTNIVTRVWQDNVGYVWIETANGLCRYDGYGITQIDNSTHHVSLRSEVLKTRDAEWVRMGEGRLERRGKNKDRQSWQLISKEVIAYTHNDHFHVADVNEYTEAISTYGSGLFLYDKRTRELTRIVNNGLNYYSFLTNLFVDHTGCIWVVADYLGVLCIRMNTQNYFRRLLVDTCSISDRNHIRSIAHYGKNKLCICNQLGEIYEYDTQKHTVDFLKNAPQKVYSTLKDRFGRLWIGTRGAGLWVEDKKIEGLPSPQIYKIIEDARGDIRVAMLQGGVAIIGDKGIKTYLKGKNCHDMIFDDSGRWWVAAEDSLYIFDVQGKKQLARGVANGYFVCLCKDKKGRVWAASIGNGILKCAYSAKDVKVEYYTMNNGLPNNNVYSIVEDKNGNIWAGTEDGLSSINPVTGDVRNLLFPISPLANVYNERAAVSLINGRIVFGTHEGFIEIEPEAYVVNNNMPITIITSLAINGEKAEMANSDFNYKEYNLTFNFSNFQYSSLNSVLYRYWLEGYDAGWGQPVKEHSVTYRKLPPGHYVFHVRSNNGMGQWGEETTYEFTIHQPWWNTLWAWMFYVLLFVAIVIIVWHTSLRILTLHRQIDVERRMSAFKKDFYDRIERELCNPVNVLHGATENVQINGTSKTTVQSLRRGSKRMMKLMDMIRQFHKLSDVEIQIKAETDTLNAETEKRFQQIVKSVHAEDKEYREMAPPPINNFTILIIEDDEDNLTHLTDTLNPYFRIIGNRKIEECENMVATHHPSLTIIDITYDEKVGFELIRRLHEDTPELPIIHLSSYDDDVHQLRSLRSGAMDYIVKPFSGKVLLERVRKVLELSANTNNTEVPVVEKTEILTDVRDKKFLDRMETTLRTHIGEDNFSVEQWAAIMNLGRTQFYKRVKALTGETPVQHLQNARLEYAACLLKETNATIEEIMLKTGYHNATHFYNSFKKKYGMSPKMYRG